jgi:hypothetical protein
MITSSEAENFANATQLLLDCFCSWVHYNHLLNPTTAKGVKQLATSCQYNVQAESHQSVFGSLGRHHMLDRWIPSEPIFLMIRTQ